MNTEDKPIIAAFPLRGEWLSPNTPGTKIPSHGTDRFGTRYAYDFIQVDWKRKGRPAYRVSFLHYLLFGVPLKEYCCWGQNVYAPCGGTVLRAEDGCEERPRTHFLSDLVKRIQKCALFRSGKGRCTTGCGQLHYSAVRQKCLRCARPSSKRIDLCYSWTEDQQRGSAWKSRSLRQFVCSPSAFSAYGQQRHSDGKRHSVCV